MIMCHVASKLLLPNDIDHKKKLPYGRFYLCTKTFGHNTFSIALHVMKMDNFNFLNYKITNNNN